ncbi:hypothetical protein DRP05_05940 [Archaeoglobales archaeon]|nr:MAG: hypothetical protein DRP05_05940 [Archaeoglobales archaeon]
MIRKVRDFYNKLPKYSKDRDISMRLQGAVAKAMRSSCYEFKANFSDFEDIFKKHLLAAFVDSRIFEKAKKGGKTKECFSIAERITRELWSELKNMNEKDMWGFFESFVKLYEVKRSKIEL